jgi:hypothetical protein
VATVEPSCPIVEFFPYTIRFESKTVISWGTPATFGGYRGDLGAVRASGGNFAGTFDVGSYGTGTSLTVDAPWQPPPAQLAYYLLQGSRLGPPDRCTRYSYSTGSPAELPGAGGTRDEDFGEAPDPGCP